jgi:signal transduction histidine kinase
MKTSTAKGTAKLHTPRRWFRSNSEMAFVVVVLAAYLVLFTNQGYQFRLLETLLLVGLGLVYLLVGIFGARRIERRRSTRLIVSFLAIQMVLGSLIIYLGEGQTWLVLLPLVSSAVEYLPRPWSYFTVALIWVAQFLPFYLLAGWSTALAWGIPFLAAVVFVAVFTEITVSEQKARAELAQANNKLREYASKVEELAVVQERNRLAREIHDGLGHYLTAINIQLRAAQAVAGTDISQALAAMGNAQTLAQEALADVRRSVSSLRADPSTSRPLPEALSQLLTELHASGIRTNFILTGPPRPLPAQADFTIYRAVQEGLTNIRKHARASQVNLQLEYCPDCVRILLQDDGIGAAKVEGGFGLLGLEERLKLVGGSQQVDTAPGKGFRLQVEVPTNDAGGPVNGSE